MMKHTTAAQRHKYPFGESYHMSKLVETVRGEKYKGKPCKKCENELRLVSNRKCINCENKRLTVRRKTDTVRAQRAMHQRKWKYGLTQEEYNIKLNSQNGCCAICSRVLDGSNRDATPCVDHNHTTGKIRGLLCRPCNQAVGCLQDKSHLCQLAANYLDIHNSQVACMGVS
jgi:Recombination endonuclease VII